MSNRITIKNLERRAAEINRRLGRPAEPHADGKAQVGCLYISSAYGGYSLELIVNEGGGASAPLGAGHRPARELYDEMGGILVGLDLAQAEG